MNKTAIVLAVSILGWVGIFCTNWYFRYLDYQKEQKEKVWVTLDPQGRIVGKAMWQQED